MILSLILLQLCNGLKDFFLNPVLIHVEPVLRIAKKTKIEEILVFYLSSKSE